MTVPQPSPLRKSVLVAIVAALAAGRADAHASEQGFVLLLPTDVYMTAGAASVALTVVLLAVLPPRVALAMFRPLTLFRWRRGRLHLVTSGLSFLLLLLLLWAGIEGPRDPLANPLPLMVWTVFWIGLVVAQGLLGDLWRWLNPWSGPLALARLLGLCPVAHLPHRLGPWLALAGFLAFAGFTLADIAPADPGRLARAVGLYWLAMFAAGLVFGPRFLLRAEALTVLMTCYARLGLFGRLRGRIALGVPGWQLLTARAPSTGLAVFMLALLATGSFDGLNETFWWLARLGINPLEFPGRSAVVAPNLIGLLAANAALAAAFALAVHAGLVLGGRPMPTRTAFRLFAPAILPIALGYHIAHYLTAFLVDGQYALIAASDPLANGADLLGLGQFYVTTGFFNTQDSVRAIFLTQAGAVVIGHILAIASAHAIALRAFTSPRIATLSQAPLAVFMVLYTFFGLWLLASPRGA